MVVSVINYGPPPTVRRIQVIRAPVNSVEGKKLMGNIFDKEETINIHQPRGCSFKPTVYQIAALDSSTAFEGTSRNARPQSPGKI
ncbi:hypothetical protein JTE90_002548 [Oedothorax gibbosus]|uniref:Uncharacterized protein n=1 Tax=Oedothorax gibbosus TaxID=931172 RepID=A0AAV6V3G9_9ARAC|nr:hypothetical protein JTE90_002548 [Oedothorax gibbosus]